MREAAAARIFAAIGEIGEDAWNRCFPDEPESYAFYRAVEEAGPPGFSWRYLAVVEDDVFVAVVPAFLTRYRLDTTVQGPLKRLASALTDALPGLFTLDLASLGSPVAEICHLGFAPGIAAGRQAELLGRILDGLEALAAEEGCGLMAVKDAPEGQIGLWRAALGERRFQPMPGLPIGTLAVPAGGLDAYLATLSRATRKDLRRKEKKRAALRVERRTNIDDVLERVSDLYEQTVAHSDLTFEHLPPAYFSAVLRHLAPSAQIVLYWAGDELVAFNFVIETPSRLVDKYIGMHYPAVRELNLYFLSWLENVDYCSRKGIPVYQAGQGFYGPKVRLGCRLAPNWLFFRHRRAWINALLRAVAKIVSLDRFDPEIAGLMREREGSPP